VLALPPGEGFFAELAAHVLARWPGPDLANLRVLVPALPIAAELRAALARAAPGPLVLPRCDTLRNWAGGEPLPGIPEPLPEAGRRVLLHEALRQRNWFDETALWGIAAELAGLFDELTAAAVRLPDDEAGLAEQLGRAYALRASAPLAF
jgi:ATP-dependent helicase/nuclease subunit B